MADDLQRRVEDLEQEVQQLRYELNELKHITQTANQITYNNQPIAVAKKVLPEEQLDAKTSETIESVTQNVKETRPIKPQKSLEERVIWALPKVFMVILILGVLWGLKLVSDYGILSDAVKLTLSFILSITLGIAAYRMEKKQKGSPAITIALYGGAFIIGILTTAAGAIIYEVLSLYVALLIALSYIAYGIVISYVKKNEILTNFVAFTSLLLPYLLEYMAFNPFMILLFILVLYSALQVVILKNVQRVALYVSTFFSILAALIIWGIGENNGPIFSVSTILYLAIFLYSWWSLYSITTKLKSLHEGLLFSISSLSLLFINLMSRELSYQVLVIALVALIFVAVAMLAYKKQLKPVLDITGTIALLSGMNALIVMNISENAENILVPLSAFVGLMVALYLRTSVMKVTYSLIFTITTFVSITQFDVRPLWTVDHFIVLMQLIYLLVIYLYMKRPKQELTKFEAWMKSIYIEDIVPLFISLYFIAYMLKIDYEFISHGNRYFVTVLIAFIMLGTLFVAQTYIGKFLPYMFVGLFLILSLSIMPVRYEYELDWQNIATRLVYIVIILAIVADLYMKGAIYRKWSRYLGKINDGVISGGFILTALSIIALIGQLENDSVIGYKLAVAVNTIVLFITAGSALWLSTLQKLRLLRLTGFTALFIAIIKLIFFDLSTLDLFIRAILFITIGGLGLLLSNRLLKKSNE